MTRYVFAFGLLLLTGTATADTEFLAGVGIGFGGDELATVSFTDGSDQDLRAGSGFAFNLGLVHHFEDSPYSLQATTGYFVHDTSAENTNARFSRYPIEVLGFWRRDEHRLGGGIVHHMSPTLDMDNLGGTFDFDDATGFVLEYGYSYFSIRYTSLEYSIGSAEVDGSGIGIFANIGY